MPHFLVHVINATATKGEQVPVEAATEAAARKTALESTPDPLDEVLRVDPITAAEYKRLRTPPPIPPAQP